MKNQSRVRALRLKGDIEPFYLTTLPRYGAKTRSGQPCRRYCNLKNGHCKLQGGNSTGPKRDTNGNNNPNYRTGLNTRAQQEQEQEQEAIVRRMARDSRELRQEIVFNTSAIRARYKRGSRRAYQIHGSASSGRADHV